MSPKSLSVLVLAAAAAFTLAESATALEFQPGSFYGGPRVWVGNLNGATAIGAQLEKGLTDPGQYGPGVISGGVGLDWYSWSFDYPSGSYDYSVVPLQVFSNYHFAFANLRKWDPYAGLALVYSIVSASWDGAGVEAADASGSYLDVAGQAGTRYFVTDTFALQAQVGFGYGTLGLGGTWMF